MKNIKRKTKEKYAYKKSNNKITLTLTLIIALVLSLTFSYINNLKASTQSQFGKPIILEKEGFHEKLVEIGENMDENIGKKIILEGICYKEEWMKEDEVVIGRILENSTTEDYRIVGLICYGKKVTEVKINDWVRIQGKISTKEFLNKATGIKRNYPAIEIQKIEKIAPLKDPFVTIP